VLLLSVVVVEVLYIVIVPETYSVVVFLVVFLVVLITLVVLVLFVVVVLLVVLVPQVSILNPRKFLILLIFKLIQIHLHNLSTHKGYYLHL